MLTLLFFRPEHDIEPSVAEIAAAASEIPGVALEPGDGYRPGRWRDPETRATCVIDIGEPPIERDSMHPPRAYAGWRQLPVTVLVPIAGPHWRCVEAMRPVEALLAAFPTWCALDTEDIQEDPDAPVGPAPWSRPRVIASWERLREARIEHLGTARMPRRASVAMWRYLRERPRGRERHPGHAWPDAVALLDVATGAARSAAAWTDVSKPLAVPPVDVLAVVAGSHRGVTSADQLATMCGAADAGIALARLVGPNDDVARFLSEYPLSPIEGFKALDDEDWAD